LERKFFMCITGPIVDVWVFHLLSVDGTTYTTNLLVACYVGQTAGGGHGDDEQC
jgi:hypothetical protein